MLRPGTLSASKLPWPSMIDILESEKEGNSFETSSVTPLIWLISHRQFFWLKSLEIYTKAQQIAQYTQIRIRLKVPEYKSALKFPKSTDFIDYNLANFGSYRHQENGKKRNKEHSRHYLWFDGDTYTMHTSVAKRSVVGALAGRLGDRVRSTPLRRRPPRQRWRMGRRDWRRPCRYGWCPRPRGHNDALVVQLQRFRQHANTVVATKTMMTSYHWCRCCSYSCCWWRCFVQAS